MDTFQGNRVLFITTKNLDYLRNAQEIKLLQKNAGHVEVIGSKSRSYIVRLCKVYATILLCNMRKYDKVFIGFAPQLVLPFFRWKFKKNEIVIDFFISVYDTLVFDRRKFREESFAAKILKRLDNVTIKAADRVISDTKAHGQYFVEEFGLQDDRLSVLYLEADKSIYYPRKQSKPERMKGRFTVLYFGSVLPLQGLDVILDAVRQLQGNSQLYFVIVGPIQDKYQPPEGDDIEYHNWLSQQDLAEYISYADLCLAGHFNRDVNKAKRTIPGKAYIYNAMEKPMILGDNPANRELYSENQSGVYFVEMGNAGALADKIQEIAASVSVGEL
jgi:glycosyltransferase involved in cell wall biosynthesis